MTTKFQEHCPDIERQEADVQKLNKRFNNLNRQIDTRWEGQDKLKVKICASIIIGRNTEHHTTKNTSHRPTDKICIVISFAVCCRSQSLQRAKMSYKNYRNDYDNLNSWLSRVPNYEPRETDDLRQVDTKLKNQRVRVMNSAIHAYIFLNHITGVEEYSVDGAVEKSLHFSVLSTELAVWYCKKGVWLKQCLQKCPALPTSYQSMYSTSILFHHDYL